MDRGPSLAHPFQAPWHERLLSEQRRHQKQLYRLNSLMLRDDEIAPKATGQNRVLVVGDSCSFGLGVEDPRAVFPDLLEQHLAAGPDGGVEVLNGDIPGSLTGEWLALWEKVAPIFDPDARLIVFFLRDGTETGSLPNYFDRIRSEISLRNHFSAPYRISHLYRMWRDARDRREVGRSYTREFEAAYLGGAETTGEWRRAQANLLALLDAARARGTEVGLAVFPILVDLGEDYPFRAITERVTDFGRDNGSPTHDLLPAYLGRHAPDLWVSPLDQHPDAQGHRLAAESLRPFVTALLAGSARRPDVASPAP